MNVLVSESAGLATLTKEQCREGKMSTDDDRYIIQAGNDYYKLYNQIDKSCDQPLTWQHISS